MGVKMKRPDRGEPMDTREAAQGLLKSIEWTPANLAIAATAVSTLIGSLYGGFEIYKDYMAMKEAIQTYVAPDLSGLNEKMSVVEKEVKGIKENVNQATDYTNEIKNDLKSDIRRLEKVVENVERTSKQNQRETDLSVRVVQNEMRATQKEMDNTLKALEKNVDSTLKNLEKNLDEKIKKALDNPLNN